MADYLLVQVVEETWQRACRAEAQAFEAALHGELDTGRVFRFRDTVRIAKERLAG